jgi:hypothetical protein
LAARQGQPEVDQVEGRRRRVRTFLARGFVALEDGYAIDVLSQSALFSQQVAA